MELLKNTSLKLTKLYLVLVLLTIVLLPLVTTVILFYYVTQLEKETCDCIKDWRHRFLKYMLFGNIVLSVLNMALLLNNMIGTKVHKTLYVMTVFIGVVNTYSYFTYITDLNKTKCNCLKDMPKINEFLSVMKWVFVGLTSFSFITLPLYYTK
tara:strand:- start:648 stop:1106 length:459 start_codon:yes stop_codon:yes gene_type:complete